MSNEEDCIVTLRNAAQEIKALRNEITHVKAAAFDMHCNVIERILGQPVREAPCPAYRSEALAQLLEGQLRDKEHRL